MNVAPQMSCRRGKGYQWQRPCVPFLSHVKEAGFKVGTPTSPHLLRYNERIAINTHRFQMNDCFLI